MRASLESIQNLDSETYLTNARKITDSDITKGSNVYEQDIKSTDEYLETVKGKSSGGVNGDLVVVFRQIENSNFEVDGNNLLMTLELDLDEALCGCEKEIDTIDGNAIKIKIPELTEYGKYLRVKGKGIKNIQYGNVVGDLLIEIRYRKLTKITEKQKKLIKEFYGR